MKKFLTFTFFTVLLLTLSCSLDLSESPAAKKTDSAYVMVPRDISGLTNQWANSICYGGSRNGQSPESDPPTYPTYDQVKEDLLILQKNWKYIREYGADAEAETVLQVIRNEGINLKLFLGIWICQYSNVNYTQMTNGIRLANEYPDIVAAVIVGNEALYSGSDHWISTSNMISCIRKVRNSVIQPVTVADVFDYWILPGAAPIVAEVDFIMAHFYPLWWGVMLNSATSFTTNNYNQVKNQYSNKCVMIGEAGWASRSDNTAMITNQANEENQDTYYRQLITWASNQNVLTFFFQAFDEDWKHSEPYSPYDPEKHWGLFMTNRTAKLAMYNIYPELIDPSHVPSSN